MFGYGSLHLLPLMYDTLLMTTGLGIVSIPGYQGSVEHGLVLVEWSSSWTGDWLPLLQVQCHITPAQLVGRIECGSKVFLVVLMRIL